MRRMSWVPRLTRSLTVPYISWCDIRRPATGCPTAAPPAMNLRLPSLCRKLSIDWPPSLPAKIKPVEGDPRPAFCWLIVLRLDRTYAKTSLLRVLVQRLVQYSRRARYRTGSGSDRILHSTRDLRLATKTWNDVECLDPFATPPGSGTLSLLQAPKVRRLL